MTPLDKWEPCLAGMNRSTAFFDGITIETDRITDPRWDRVLPILEEEQVYMCRMMEPLLRAKPGAKVLDIGTGSGVFAIYAAKLGCQVVAIDVSPRALRFARYNAKMNRITVAEQEPGPGEIQLRECSFERLEYENEFDFVFLAPPYNPTCPGFVTALHADAGELGQDCFRDQLTYAGELMKPDGVCVGNQMVPANEDGALVLPDELEKSFPGGEFNYIKIISPDIRIGDFLQSQYSNFLKPQLELHPSTDVVGEYIERISSQESSEGKFFSLIYFQLRHCAADIDNPSRDAVKRNQSETLIPSPGDWSARTSLHRRIVEHTAKRSSLPSPSMFLEFDVLPNPPTRSSELEAETLGWNASVLRFIESWLEKTEILDPETGLFDLILVDSAPWYPSKEGRKGLRQESAVWLARADSQHAKACEFLSLYQENTERLQRTSIGPFLHRQFSGRDAPNSWRDVFFTTNDTLLEADFGKLGDQNRIVDQMVKQLTQIQVEKRQRDVQSPPSILQAAYTESDLSELDVSHDLQAFDQVVDERLKRLRAMSEIWSAATDEELLVVDLELCHQAMHSRLDALAKKLGAVGVGTTALVGVPISVTSLAIDEETISRHALPSSYRGGLWIYGISSSAWHPNKERYLLDLAKLLTKQYEAEYSVRAADAQRRTGTASSRTNWAHECVRVVEGLRRQHLDPEEFGFEVRRRPENASDGIINDFGIIAFDSLYQAGMDHLMAWATSNNEYDLPFEELPTDIGELIEETYQSVADAILVTIFRRVLITPETLSYVESVLSHIRARMPKIRIITSNDVLRSNVDWSDNRQFWVDLTKMLMLEFREALQHSKWEPGISIAVEMFDGRVSRLAFKNEVRQAHFDENIGSLPKPPKHVEVRMSAITQGFLEAGDNSGGGVIQSGNGKKIRRFLAESLGAKMTWPSIDGDADFEVAYQWSRSSV